MNVCLSKNIFGYAKINSSKLAGIFGPKNIEGTGLSNDEIANTIQNPLGTSPLSEMAKGCKNVLIITDDYTRQTPLSRILPLVIDELKAAGISDAGIQFLIGLGSHRPMNREELKEKFGDSIVERYKITNHSWKNSNSLISLGKFDLGYEVIINKLVQNADLLITVGSIVPHATTGFSGGGKSILPGICGERTVEDTHWKALDYSMREILGLLNNPIRDAINSICRRVNLNMIINTVLFNGNKIYGVAAGDFELAFKKGVGLCREIFEVQVPEKAEIVIAEAYPSDINLRQAIKAICAADLVCDDGGVIILPAECIEGIAPQFPEFSKFGFKNPDMLFDEVEEGRFKEKLIAYTLITIGRIISKRVRAILVSPNVCSALAQHMGFIWASSLQDAVDRAVQMSKEKSRIIVLQQSSQILPVHPS